MLIAAVIVTGVVVHARTPKLELEVVHLSKNPFSPNGDGHRDTARITFYVRDSDQNARVQIVGPQNVVVRKLYRGPLVAYKRTSFTWNGRTNSGRPANPNDGYRLRVILPGQGRDMVYPTQIRLRKASVR